MNVFGALVSYIAVIQLLVLLLMVQMFFSPGTKNARKLYTINMFLTKVTVSGDREITKVQLFTSIGRDSTNK